MVRTSPILLLFVLAACPPKPIVYLPEDQAATRPAATGPAATGAESLPTEKTRPGEPTPPPISHAETGQREFALSTLAMGLELHRGTLVWADVAGAVWTMPADGSRAPKKLSEQHKDGLAVHPFVAGDHVLAKAGKGLLEIELPDGPVKHIPVTGLADLPEDLVGNASDVFMTVFNHPQVLRVAIAGGATKRVLEMQRAVLALHGETLYLASYTTGALLALPVAGGSPRTIATKLKQPTALAVDDAAAYVYTEGDQKLTRIDLATGAAQVLGDHLNNSDEVELAGTTIYTVSWPNKLMRLTTTPGGATPIADNLFQPRGVVHDDHWVYVTSDNPPRIVRIPRQ